MTGQHAGPSEALGAAPQPSLPLAGMVVIDLSRALAGPHAAMMLGDLGARVIKVEPPEGDDSRRWGPPFVSVDRGAGEEAAAEQVATYFLACNRNKESIVLDLKQDEDRAVLLRLVARADVLVENLRAGARARLGLDHDELLRVNPRLVVLSVSGFGHTGPEADRAGYDQIAQGEAGLMSLAGAPGEPAKVGVPITDLLAGIHGVVGVTAALAARASTGAGTVVHSSLLAGVIGVHSFQATRWTVGGERPEAIGNHHPTIAPYGSFAAADRPLQVAIGTEAHWRTFAALLGLDPDAAEFATNADRVRHRDELITVVERALAGAPADHWLAVLQGAGLAAGRIRTIDEVYAWDQVRALGLVVEVEHPLLGPLSLPGSPVSFPGPERQHTAPPLLDEHRADILAWVDESVAEAAG